MTTFLFGMIGSPWQLMLIAFIALLLFGNRIPQLAKSLGQGVTEFKKGLNTDEDDDEENDDEDEEEPPKKVKKSKKKAKVAEDSEDEDEE